MIIETEYNIGDTLFFIDSNRKISKFKISKIQVSLSEYSSKPFVYYSPGKDIWHNQNVCGKTQEELFNKIKL